MSFWPFFKSLIKKLLDKAPWLECFYWEYVKFRIRSGRLVEKNMFRRLITITDYSENEKGLVSKRCLGLFLNYVLINVPYYRDLSQKGFIDSLDIKTFPVITKADFRENFNIPYQICWNEVLAAVQVSLSNFIPMRKQVLEIMLIIGTYIV